jgi:hypothetical protein
VASFHGFVIPMILVAGGVFFLWRARRRPVFALLLLATLVSVPFGLYQLSLSSVFNSNWQQDVAGLENVPSLLISRALLWPFIAMGAWAALRDPERRPGPSFALCWAVSALAFDLFPPFAQTELHRVVEGSPFAYGVLAAPGLLRLHHRPRAYVIAAMMMAPVIGAVLLVLAGPLQRESYLPAGYLAIAQQLERSGDTRCVVGSDLTMLWVSALSHACDAQSDASKSPTLLKGLSAATTAQAAADLLPQPDDLVVWGDYEVEYGPSPTTLKVVATYRRAVLLSLS